eukprot:2607317-Prymnesium_polylepis.4
MSSVAWSSSAVILSPSASLIGPTSGLNARVSRMKTRSANCAARRSVMLPTSPPAKRMVAPGACEGGGGSMSTSVP